MNTKEIIERTLKILKDFDDDAEIVDIVNNVRVEDILEVWSEWDFLVAP